MTTAECLFACIRYIVFDTELTQTEKMALSDEPLESLYRLSAQHDLAHLVCEALKRNRLLPDNEWGKAFQKKKDLAMFRYIQQSDAYEAICRTLEEAGVAYVPLKGAILRELYPEPWMRTSCDIDVLIHEEDLDRAVSVLMDRLGYYQGSKNYHDISLYSPNGTHLELHFHIQEAAPALDRVLSQVWDYIEPEAEGSLHFYMTNEFFVFHQLAHMSYHFVTGGCGLRSLLDYRILAAKMAWDQKILDSLLEQGGIRSFAEMISSLSEKCFGTEHTLTQDEEKIVSYILHGGVYGNKENHIRSQQARRGGAKENVLQRIWLPYDSLKNYYKSLEGRRYLLPVYEVRRWIRIVFKEKKGVSSIREIQSNLTVSDQERNEMKEIFESLGLTEQYHD